MVAGIVALLTACAGMCKSYLSSEFVTRAEMTLHLARIEDKVDKLTDYLLNHK